MSKPRLGEVRLRDGNEMVYAPCWRGDAFSRGPKGEDRWPWKSPLINHGLKAMESAPIIHEGYEPPKEWKVGDKLEAYEDARDLSQTHRWTGSSCDEITVCSDCYGSSDLPIVLKWLEKCDNAST